MVVITPSDVIFVISTLDKRNFLSSSLYNVCTLIFVFIFLMFTFHLPSHNFKSNRKFSRKILFFEVIIKRHILDLRRKLLMQFYSREETTTVKILFHFWLSHQSWLNQQHKFYHNFVSTLCVYTFTYTELNSNLSLVLFYTILQ